MKYVITINQEPNDNEAEIIDGKENMEKHVMQLFEDGYVEDDDEVYVYPLGKRITYTLERKLVGKEK